MRSEVIVQFGPDRLFELLVHAPMTREEARRWLDQAFVDNDCEPLRASGKVLTADKILAIADTVGPSRFESDAAFADGFARAATGALERAVVKVEVDAGAVSF